jgi:SAM-dependent methyltransferase
VYSDAQTAALYDVMYPWDPDRWPGDRFFDELVMAADSVLDVGCGTGSMLHRARERGHGGRLVGLDPDRAALDRARRRTDVEWVDGTAADVSWQAEFDLVTMASNAFQCLITDDDVRASLAAIRAAVRDGGRFAFDSRHPQARAWKSWNASNASDVVDMDGRALRVWNEVESIDGDVVTVTETIASPDGTVLRVGRDRLRFLGPPGLNAFLAEAGFAVEAQYGEWGHVPISDQSRAIITIAARA